MLVFTLKKSKLLAYKSAIAVFTRCVCFLHAALQDEFASLPAIIPHGPIAMLGLVMNSCNQMLFNLN
jgi:hypothetical protein